MLATLLISRLVRWIRNVSGLLMGGVEMERVSNQPCECEGDGDGERRSGGVLV